MWQPITVKTPIPIASNFRKDSNVCEVWNVKEI